ncbi:oligosaccharide flippase family protein [uncultured Muribaculum sp.]|uniref:oligosaccharide flippase family protein n=1 Tax=uncultured Muribaculum sp. TaxID=1918613 RepID=UPI0025D5EBD5|nr:oligosaccharide flippase family protein [uncultured Muribaculum sp.]
MANESTIVKENSYRSIMRGMSAFGGVQVLQIAINVVRGKCVALLLGPEGMGISQLLVSSTNTLKQAASCGLPMSIVREVAATRDGDASALDTDSVVAVARRVVRWTALLAMLLCGACSMLLSRLTFDNDLYTWSFVALSVMMLFSVMADGEMSLLQGLHEVKRLSKASLVGALTALVGGVPLYWFFGYGGIVPAMILMSVVTWAFFRYNMGKTHHSPRVDVARDVRKALTRRLLALGLVLMAGTVLTTLTGYLVNMWVRSIGGVADVGLFQAANSIAGQYVGVVFTAMSLDYFPRLSAAISDNRRMTVIVNRQYELVGLIVAPLAIILMLTAPVLIRVLTSEAFMGVVPLVRWMALGLFLRAMAYPLGYIAFAKGNKRLYFCLEGVFGCSVMLVVNCLCYWLWGLVGLGVAMVVVHAVDVAAYYVVNRRAYGYRIDGPTLRLMIILFVPVLLSFLATLISDIRIGSVVTAVLLAVTLVTSFRGIRSRLSR